MQCENSKCKKLITNAYACNKCTNKFCSNSCMIDHYFEVHQFSTDNSKLTNILPTTSIKKTNKKKSVSSLFIKSGEFLKEIRLDPYFKFDNFEKVKMGKKTQILGAGAFGDVYLVKHKEDGKFFAVKQMYKKRILDSGAKLDIVRREIDIHSRLIHPNIIKLYSYHEDEQAFYLILEYANSGTLFTTIRRSKGLDEKKAFKYFIQTAAAVHFIHENNLIHRDIKPENLLLDENDNIKLCDFGWCIELEIGNRTTFCGTIEYMAPEIIKEMPYDRSIDVWSLGILLYELIHGYSPFRAIDAKDEEEHTQIFKNIIKFKFKIDKANISDNCKDIITKLLNTDISSRIKTKDIFTHPWVIEFENYHTDNSSINNNKKNNVDNNTNSNIIPINNKNPYNTTHLDKVDEVKQVFQSLKNEELPPSKSPIKEIRDKSADNKKSGSKKNSMLEEHREKIKENLLMQKQSSVQYALNSTQDFSHFSSLNKTESLFDKVLTQVTDKNKDKRKKTKMFYEQYDHEEIEKIIEKENKIVLKIQREERQKSVEPSKKENKIPRPKNFQMLMEIKEIDKNIEKHIDEANKKNDLIKNTKDELSKVFANENVKKINLSKLQPLDDDDEISTYSNYFSNSNSNLNNYTSKKGSVSNNLIVLHPKSYFLEDDVGKFSHERHDLSAEMNTEKVKSKNPRVNEIKNYNEELYLNNRGRDTNKNPKNSITHRKTNSGGYGVKEFLYGDKGFEDGNPNILAAIEMLEKAQENKKEMDTENKNSKNFWERFSSFINPFKCE